MEDRDDGEVRKEGQEEIANNRVSTSHLFRFIVEKILSHIVDPEVSNPRHRPFREHHNILVAT